MCLPYFKFPNTSEYNILLNVMSDPYFGYNFINGVTYMPDLTGVSIPIDSLLECTIYNLTHEFLHKWLDIEEGLETTLAFDTLEKRSLDSSLKRPILIISEQLDRKLVNCIVI